MVDGERLAHFYDALAALERGERTEPVRIAAFGDSNLTMDFTTGAIRRRLQERFGDGGHGFVAAVKPWSHYQHRDVRHGAVSGYRAFSITTHPTGDGMYGLGGIVAENQWQGARTFFQTAEAPAPVGREVARFDVFYLERRYGGTFDLLVDGARQTTVDTRGAPGLGHARVDVPLGPHRLDVVASSPEAVRVLGAAMETGKPGVVIDSFGVGALNTTTLTLVERSHAIEMMRARGYELIVLMTGANDLFVLDRVPEAMRELAARFREALPEVSILVVTPADRGRKRSFPLTLKVVAQRPALARENGAAFWDLWRAMGGEGAMSRFVRDDMADPDAIHLNARGADRIAEAFVEAFDADYERHRARAAAAPCVAQVSRK